MKKSGISTCSEGSEDSDSDYNKYLIDSISSGTMTSTKMQSRSITRTSKNNGNRQTSRRLMQQQSLTSICSVEDSPANRFQLLVEGRDSRILEELCSLRYVGSHKRKDLECYSLRMSKDSLATTTEGHSPPSSYRWMNWGMMSNGKCLTVRILECHRIGRGCSLSDILEKNPPEKYFLSEKLLIKIMEKKAAHPNIHWKSGIHGEGAVPFPDDPMKPSRTITPAEGGGKQDDSWDKGESMRMPLKFLERNQRNIEGDYSFTIDSVNTGGVSSQGRIRRLTPIECERLQGFPDGWTEGISDTQRYKCLGNAVTVNVIQAIGESLLKHAIEG